jgi:hypothetical protein
MLFHGIPVVMKKLGKLPKVSELKPPNLWRHEKPDPDTHQCMHQLPTRLIPAQVHSALVAIATAPLRESTWFP